MAAESEITQHVMCIEIQERLKELRFGAGYRRPTEEEDQETNVKKRKESKY